MIPVTFLLAVHNEEERLPACLKSLSHQTFKDFEIVAIDDASTDKTGQILREYPDKRLRVIHNQKQLGLTASLNRGLGKARGNYIARIDADDLAVPERLAKQVSYLEAHPQVGVLGGEAKILKPDHSIVYRRFPTDPTTIWYQLHFYNCLTHPTATFRSQLIRDYGMYDQNYSTSQDFELWSRLSQHTQIHNMKQVMVIKHDHSETISQTNPSQYTNALKIVENRLTKICGYPLNQLILTTLHTTQVHSPIWSTLRHLDKINQQLLNSATIDQLGLDKELLKKEMIKKRDTLVSSQSRLLRIWLDWIAPARYLGG